MAITTVYKCADGSDFPVTWDDPSDAELAWRFDPEHAPLPCPHIELELRATARPEGLTRAFAEFGLPSPAADDRVLLVEGFAFTNREDPAPEMAAARRIEFDSFTASHGGPLATWEDVLLPRIREACAHLASLSDTTDPEYIIREMWYAFGFAQVSYLTGLIGMLGPLRRFCAAEFMEDTDSLVGGLTKGYPSATLEADQALWELSQMVKSNPDLGRAISSQNVDLEILQADQVFWSRFQEFIDIYGHRAGHWQVAAPTWFEEPRAVLAIIGRMAESDTSSPMETIRETATDREQLVQELEGRLVDNQENLETFRGLVDDAASNEPIREGRVYWQLHCFGYAREALLRVGARLVREARIGEAGDVMFLTPAEVRKPNGLDLKGLSAGRRALWEERCRISPPVVIGRDAVSASLLEGFRRPPVAETTVDGSIKGVGASTGVATGPARVIHSPLEGGRLSPGDVLVCVMTAPPWTPLFGVASAVVTESGGALSHPAIVAREYGIPCVVGARGATGLIQDGQLITVDGTKGEVRLDS